jgi:hypothetical protein
VQNEHDRKERSHSSVNEEQCDKRGKAWRASAYRERRGSAMCRLARMHRELYLQLPFLRSDNKVNNNKLNLLDLYELFILFLF